MQSRARLSAIPDERHAAAVPSSPLYIPIVKCPCGFGYLPLRPFVKTAYASWLLESCAYRYVLKRPRYFAMICAFADPDQYVRAGIEFCRGCCFMRSGRMKVVLIFSYFGYMLQEIITIMVCESRYVN